MSKCVFGHLVQNQQYNLEDRKLTRVFRKSKFCSHTGLKKLMLFIHTVLAKPRTSYGRPLNLN